MRLFAAVPLPDNVIERLTSLRLRLSSPRDGLRWSPPEQWHVTLQFFGDVEEETAFHLRAGLCSIQVPAAQLAIEALGLFAAKGILFASVETTPSLLRLQERVQREAERCGVQAESKPFHPHITLARSRGKTGFQTLQRMSAPALPTVGSRLQWRALEYRLLQSELSLQGAQYTTLARVPLVPC